MTDGFDVEALEALAGQKHFADAGRMAAPDWSLDLPCAPDEERAVLGAMLLDEREAAKAAAMLEAEDFTEGRHAALFRALSARLAAGQPVDGVTLATSGELDQNSFAGYVDAAVRAGASAGGAWKAHAETLRSIRARRDLIWAARRLISAAVKDGCDVPAVTAAAQQALSGTQRLSLAVDTSPETLLDGYEQTVRSWSGQPLAKSGIAELDKAIGGGLLPGEILAVVGGDGSMKTSLALRFGDEYLRTIGRPVLYLSLDMRPERIALRRLLPLAETGEKRLTAAITEHQADFAAVRARRAALDAGRYHIADGPLRLADIESLVSRLSPGLVIWDYLTATDGFRSEMDAQRACVSALRSWQHRYDATWVVLSQMSELAKAGQRQGDFAGRGSGGNNLSRVADTQLELFLDDVEPQKYHVDMGIMPKPRLVCTVTKCRSGVRGSIWELDYDGPTMSFTGTAERVKRAKAKKPLFEAAGVIV